MLIHAAAGGVGLAAVQIAQRAGAEVFATASPAKWDYLRSLGVCHLCSSRSLEFTEQVRDLTGGCGVDLALNSLAGDYIGRTVATLAPGGRFVEIGKRDIWSAARMAQVRPDVAYHVLALDELMVQTPAEVGSRLRELMELFDGGALRPSRHTVYPMEQAPAAFRALQQARPIGKVVLAVRRSGDFACQGDASYLITGGLGGLGLEVARWLVEHGARHLILIGRREPSDAAARAVAGLREAGAEVVVAPADVASEADLAAVLARAPRPVRGVVHAAGVLDDGVLMQQTWARFEAVLAPKVQGAWNLHRLTRDQPLDFFVLFSSSAALLGSPGQGSYTAGNAFLDALAHHRRALGLPALSIDWGPWSGVGMAAALDEQRRRWAALGVSEIAPPQGLELLQHALTQDLTQVAALPVDWVRFLRTFPAGAAPKLLADLAPAETSAERPTRLRARLAQAALAERGIAGRALAERGGAGNGVCVRPAARSPDRLDGVGPRLAHGAGAA